MNFIFKDIWVLVFIPVVFLFLISILKRQKSPSIKFSTTHFFKELPSGWRVRLEKSLAYVRFLTLFLFIIALAGPRIVETETITQTEGIDIVLAIDSSGSMAAEDFILDNKRMNRLSVVKRVVGEFIEARPHDRIGLVTFAALAYTACPLTSDHTWLLKNLERIQLGSIQDGTAVGSAIMSSINRLKDSRAKSKVIILLTDGMNNAGEVDPLTAASAAKAFGIKVYTIGSGTKGYVPFPVNDIFGRKVYQNVLIDIDEETLNKIAQITDARYFSAEDTESLRDVYKEIDRMEKIKIEEKGYFQYTELFAHFLWIALILFLLEIALKHTLLLRIP